MSRQLGDWIFWWRRWMGHEEERGTTKSMKMFLHRTQRRRSLNWTTCPCLKNVDDVFVQYSLELWNLFYHVATDGRCHKHFLQLVSEDYAHELNSYGMLKKHWTHVFENLERSLPYLLWTPSFGSSSVRARSMSLYVAMPLKYWSGYLRK